MPVGTVRVEVINSTGGVANMDASSVTLQTYDGLGVNPNGTVTEPVVNGVATFSDIYYDDAGTFTLQATDGSDTAAVSNSFTIGSVELDGSFVNGTATGPVEIGLTPANDKDFVPLLDVSDGSVSYDSSGGITASGSFTAVQSKIKTPVFSGSLAFAGGTTSTSSFDVTAAVSVAGLATTFSAMTLQAVNGDTANGQITLPGGFVLPASLGGIAVSLPAQTPFVIGPSGLGITSGLISVPNQKLKVGSGATALTLTAKQMSFQYTTSTQNLTIQGDFTATLGDSDAASETNSQTTTATVQLTGKTIGTAGSWASSGAVIGKATDSNLVTYFDGPTPSGSWVGLDLGSDKTVSQIAFAPRSGYSARMVGGQIQVSSTPNFIGGVQTVYTINSAPAQGKLTTVTLSSPATGRYVRYLGPSNGYCDIAEFQVFGPDTTTKSTTPAKSSSGSRAISLDLDLTGNNSISYQPGRSSPVEFAGTLSYADTSPTPLFGKLFSISAASLSVNSVSGDVSGSITLSGPGGRTFGGNIGFVGGAIDSIGLSGSNLNIPLGPDGLFLQNISGSLTGLSPADPKPTEITAAFGLSFEALVMANISTTVTLGPDGGVDDINGTAAVNFDNGLITGSATLDANFRTNTFGLTSLAVQGFNNAVTLNGSLVADTKGDLNGVVTGTFKFPTGKDNAYTVSATEQVHVDVSSDASQSYVKAWVEFPILGFTATVGGEYTFNNVFSFLGSSVPPPITSN